MPTPKKMQALIGVASLSFGREQEASERESHATDLESKTTLHCGHASAKETALTGGVFCVVLLELTGRSDFRQLLGTVKSYKASIAQFSERIGIFAVLRG